MVTSNTLEYFLKHEWGNTFLATVDGASAESTSKQKKNQILTEGKKPEKWLKESCLVTGRTNTVRLFSLSVQESTTPPQMPELRTPPSILEVRRGKDVKWKSENRCRKWQRRQEVTGKKEKNEGTEKDKENNENQGWF